MRCALGTLNGSGRRGPRNWARFGRRRANPFGDGVRIEKADLQTAVFRCAEYPEMAEAVSKVWIEKSDGEHSRLLLLFTTSSRKREHVWREFGGVPEGNFLRSDF